MNRLKASRMALIRNYDHVVSRHSQVVLELERCRELVSEIRAQLDGTSQDLVQARTDRDAARRQAQSAWKIVDKIMESGHGHEDGGVDLAQQLNRLTVHDTSDAHLFKAGTSSLPQMPSSNASSACSSCGDLRSRMEEMEKNL
eukprot:TRINITY_DN2574_c0_g1_i1.p1 TRINITY_DN2574_c0_g1~~TRINITY_DN2574_c0_g1_i1.p1  ORF type:complete len:143 (-),score=18.02 TRINITY_DN2574_c0_g1_i1:304-732(-)